MVKDVSKTIYNDALTKASNDITARLSELGFVKTKKWQWVRVKDGAADFVHVHRSGSSYGGPINYSVSFRVHCGNRQLSDTFEALALNGPNTDDSEFWGMRLHLRFNAKSGSTYDRCIDDLIRFVKEVGEPWYMEQQKLNPGNSIHEANELSLKLLGIKSKKP